MDANDFVASWTPSLRTDHGSSQMDGLPAAAPGAFVFFEPDDMRFGDRRAADDVTNDSPLWRCVTCDSAEDEPVMGGWERLVRRSKRVL